MKEVIDVIDKILIIIGAISIFISLFKIFYNKRFWDSSVVIQCGESDEEIMYKYRAIRFIDLKGMTTIVIAPNCSPISSIKVYDTKLTKKYKIKKNKLIFKEKNILPNDACVIYADYTCGIPNTIVEIKNIYGGKFDYILNENGFNGNKDYLNGVEWKYSLFVRIFNSIFR